MTPTEELQRWAAGGAMHLTGHADQTPLGPPAGFVTELHRLAEVIRCRTLALGTEVRVDPLTLLTERAAISGMQRRGRISCGGAARLLPAADGWIAVSLPRPDDVELVPAWLRGSGDHGDPWERIAAAASVSPADRLVRDGVELGLAVVALDECDDPEPVRVTPCGDRTQTRELVGLRVVDLTALWAGPLCTSLLADAGADVVKVESTRRPDGGRAGDPSFFDLLNAGKRSVALDLAAASGRRALHELVATADVVIEASRPRALVQMGIHADDVLRDPGTRTVVWASITAHGRVDPSAGRIGFGDDAAVAGGLVSRDGDGPVFCADAVADPVTGLVTAAAVLDALADGASGMLDVAMARVAASCAGPTIPNATAQDASSPVRPRHRGRAAPLGVDTVAVLRDLSDP